MGKETILILDGDKNIAWTLKTLLENENYPVVLADTIDRAVKGFSEFQISGFITEYWIENVRTLDAIRKLKGMSPETYVMVVTDKDTREEEYEEAMHAGVDDFFLKPMPMKMILLHLQKGLRYRDLWGEKVRTERQMASRNPEREEIIAS